MDGADVYVPSTCSLDGLLWYVSPFSALLAALKLFCHRSKNTAMCECTQFLSLS